MALAVAAERKHGMRDCSVSRAAEAGRQRRSTGGQCVGVSQQEVVETRKTYQILQRN